MESNEGSKLNGSLKAKLLKSSLKSDFIFDGKSLYLNDLVFRDKNLSFNSDGILNLKPYVAINLNSKIIDLNLKLIKSIDLEAILKHKEIFKKINSNNTFSYNSKRFSTDLLESFILKTNLAYGRLIYLKQFSISDSNFQCSGDVNLLEDYPVINFDCSVDSKDKKRLLKNLILTTK